MIFKVCDQNVAAWRETNTAWCNVTLQMLIIVSRIERIFRDEMAIRREHLYAMVACVGDNNVAN